MGDFSLLIEELGMKFTLQVTTLMVFGLECFCGWWNRVVCERPHVWLADARGRQLGRANWECCLERTAANRVCNLPSISQGG
jgi:hypothetical protein